MIENNSTGTMDKLGIGFDALQAVNPGLVMVSSQLMGSHGAWSWWRGLRPEHAAAGWPRAPLELRRPRRARGLDVDLPRSRRRLPRRGGVAGGAGRTDARGVNQGVHVEVAQVETVVGMLGDLIAAEGIVAGSVVPMGNRSEVGSPWGLYRCAGKRSGWR